MHVDIPLTLSSKDIAFLLKVSSATACRLRATIRASAGIPPYAMLTVKEFCRFMKLDEEQVLVRLSSRR